MPKKMGMNSKAEEARARKNASESEEERVGEREEGAGGARQGGEVLARSRGAEVASGEEEGGGRGEARGRCGKSVVLLTSWTEKNPGRRFYRCRRCNFFRWFDPSVQPRSKAVINELLRKVKECERLES
ncbi:hypothetical protein LINPERPRIM_LOCUS31876 [Linum perenne]